MRFALGIFLTLWTLFLPRLDGSAAHAYFARQENLFSNSFSTAALAAPANLGGRAEGHDVILNWDEGQFGTGYAVLMAANGSSNDCSGAAFSEIANTALTTFEDIRRSSPQGAFFCYKVLTAHHNWRSLANNPTLAVRIGFFAESVAIVNDGDNTLCTEQPSGDEGALDCGDQILIGFNQPVNTATGPAGESDTVCADPSTNTILLASTMTQGDCNGAETVHVGSLTGGELSGSNSRFAATYDWSNNDKTLTITIGPGVGGPPAVSPTMSAANWMFAPTTQVEYLESAIGGFHVCDMNTDSADCFPFTLAGSTTFVQNSGDAPIPDGCTTVPEAVELVSPTMGAKLVRKRVQLEWTAVRCTTKYRIVVREAKSKAVVLNVGRLTDNRYRTSALKPGTTYIWRVIAKNQHGNSPATTGTFKVRSKK